MKKIIALIGLLAFATTAFAQAFTVVPQSWLADDMINDTVFYNDILLGNKTSQGDFNFGSLNFSEAPPSSFTLFEVFDGQTINVDYLGRSAGDVNNLNGVLGLNDDVLFDYYGVNSVGAVQAVLTADTNLSFWNEDETANTDGYWDNPDHFKVFSYETPAGADLLLLFVDDRGSAQPNLQDWNDGVFLVSIYDDIDQISIPEPSALGLLAAMGLLGIVAIQRKR